MFGLQFDQDDPFRSASGRSRSDLDGVLVALLGGGGSLVVSPSTRQAIPDGRLAAENASVGFDTRQEETEAELAFCQFASDQNSRDAS
jgi:hypothetical protein